MNWLQSRRPSSKRTAARRSAVLLTVLAAVLTQLVVGAATRADAYVLIGCKFDGTSPTIGYKFMNASLTFNDRLREAAGNWNSKDVPGSFTEVSGSDPEIEVSSGSYASNSNWAWVTGGCNNNPPGWNANEVTLTFNYSTVSGLTQQNIRRIAIHELGHTYGLHHDSMTCSGVPKVMETGTNKFNCSGTPPWADDQAGVKAIY